MFFASDLQIQISKNGLHLLKLHQLWRIAGFSVTPFKMDQNNTPKVVSVGCVRLWKHNGVLSEFGKIRETGKMCHVMSIDE